MNPKDPVVHEQLDKEIQMAKFRTAPLIMEGDPPGRNFIVANEVMERFGYYGLRAILSIVLIKFLPLDQLMTEQEAQAVFHQFAAWNYFFPLAGALIADILWGRYNTILFLSILYSIGCAVLALDQSRTSLYLGLGLIAMGSGAIKPNVLAYLGDQYGELNKHLVDKAITLFYKGINFGSFLSMVLTPILLNSFGPKIAFGVPAIGMFIATLVFWSGRNKYAHIPPKGKQFVKELKQGLKPIIKLVGLYLFMAAFFSLYDMSGSEWVIQASKMDLNFLGFEWLPAMIQIVNPFLIVIFAGPIENKVFPWLKKHVHPSELIRIAIGFFLVVGAFAIITWIETRIEGRTSINIGWQVAAYVLLTVGEIMAYMSVLQLSYRKARPEMKSFINAIFLLSVTLGNLFTSGVNFLIQNKPPSFVPDKPGVYSVSLSASNSQSEAVKQSLQINVLTVEDFKDHNDKKIAEQKERQLKFKEMTVAAGKTRVVRPGAKDVPLYGDVNKKDTEQGLFENIRYGWEIVKLPEKSFLTVADVEGKDRRIATFSPDVHGKYTFRLEAKIGNVKNNSLVDILVTDNILPPEVSVGDPITIQIGEDAVLDGSDTYDPNNLDLIYKWAFEKVPDGSNINTTQIISTVAGRGSWLKGSNFYLFFTLLMLVVSFIFIPFARKVDLGPDYIQPQAE